MTASTRTALEKSGREKIVISDQHHQQSLKALMEISAYQEEMVECIIIVIPLSTFYHKGRYSVRLAK